MEYKIIKMNENTYRIENMHVRCFLLIGNNKACLIDSGMTIQNIKEICKDITDLDLILINTHADRDHIGANNEFETFYMHPLEEENYHMMGGNKTYESIIEGDMIDLGDRILKVIHTPGHTPGSIALLDETNRMLFSGDPIQDGQIYMFGPMRSVEPYLNSLDKIYNMKDTFDVICPSHGTCPIDVEIILKLKQDIKDIEDGKIVSEDVFLHGMNAKKYITSNAIFLLEK